MNDLLISGHWMQRIQNNNNNKNSRPFVEDGYANFFNTPYFFCNQFYIIFNINAAQARKEMNNLQFDVK